MPESVPPVPTPATRASTFPSVPRIFRAGGALVNGGVGGVCELGGNERPRSFFGDLMCFRYGSLHAVCARCQHNRGAIGLRELATFDGHGFRHGED